MYFDESSEWYLEDIQALTGIYEMEEKKLN